MGWHNYYPRPETGLTTEYYAEQNELFVGRGLDLFAFVPGETSFRAPLGLGLPTLEHQRHRNAYRNAAELLDLHRDTQLVCAEGTLQAEHLDWILRLERDCEITLPLSDLDGSCDDLLAGTWRLRAEQTGVSQRLESSRGDRRPGRGVNGDSRTFASLQADLPALGRYAGELHLMTADLPLTPTQVRVGAVAEPYAGIVRLLQGRDTVRFVRSPRW